MVQREGVQPLKGVLGPDQQHPPPARDLSHQDVVGVVAQGEEAVGGASLQVYLQHGPKALGAHEALQPIPAHAALHVMLHPRPQKLLLHSRPAGALQPRLVPHQRHLQGGQSQGLEMACLCLHTAVTNSEPCAPTRSAHPREDRLCPPLEGALGKL